MGMGYGYGNRSIKDSYKLNSGKTQYDRQTRHDFTTNGKTNTEANMNQGRNPHLRYSPD